MGRGGDVPALAEDLFIDQTLDDVGAPREPSVLALLPYGGCVLSLWRNRSTARATEKIFGLM
ncbi:MAG: hypothetical protein LC808_04680 [Actinobacteria bacterium]|nr:hypothetical protein [Actinomycetota bacterium]